MNVIPEIRRQRHALLRKSRDPKVLYLGMEEYIGFRQEISSFMIGRKVVDGVTIETFDGMEIVERVKPGVHVCEAAPASADPAPRRCRFPNCDCYEEMKQRPGALILCRRDEAAT